MASATRNTRGSVAHPEINKVMPAGHLDVQETAIFWQVAAPLICGPVPIAVIGTAKNERCHPKPQ
jgi:hypothetical protein